MNVLAERAQAHENDDGTWTVLFKLFPEAGLELLNTVGKGGAVHLVLNKPPAQSIAPVGAESAFNFGAPASVVAPAAREARVLCDDPQFQEYAIIQTRVPLSEITNSMETALRYMLAQVGAEVPTDFEKGEVQTRFKKLRSDYAMHRALIDGPKTA